MRFVGFTGHKDPGDSFEDARDRIPFRLGANAAERLSTRTSTVFREQVLPELNRRGIAALGMKPINGHGEPVTERHGHSRRSIALCDEPAGHDHHHRHG